MYWINDSFAESKLSNFGNIVKGCEVVTACCSCVDRWDTAFSRTDNNLSSWALSIAFIESSPISRYFNDISFLPRRQLLCPFDVDGGGERVLRLQLLVNDPNKRNSDVFIQKTETFFFLFKRSQRHKKLGEKNSRTKICLLRFGTPSMDTTVF